MDDFLFDGTEISSLPARDPRLEAMLAAEVLRGFEGLATLTEAELGITRR